MAATASGMGVAAAAAAAAAAALVGIRGDTGTATGQAMGTALSNMAPSTTNSAIDKAAEALSEPGVDDAEAVKVAKQVLQAKKRELELEKINRETKLNSDLDADKPSLTAPLAVRTTWDSNRTLKEQAARLEFKHKDEDNAVILQGLEKAVEDAKAAARAARPANTAPTEPLGQDAMSAEQLAFAQQAQANATASSVGPISKTASEDEKRAFFEAVKTGLSSRFETLKNATNLSTGRENLLTDVYDNKPFIVRFTELAVDAAKNNNVGSKVTSLNLLGRRTYRKGLEAADRDATLNAATNAVQGSSRRTPRRLRGGASTDGISAFLKLILDQIAAESSVTNPTKAFAVADAFALLVAHGTDDEDAKVAAQLTGVFNTFLAYRAGASSNPARKLIASVMFSAVPAEGLYNKPLVDRLSMLRQHNEFWTYMQDANLDNRKAAEEKTKTRRAAAAVAPVAAPVAAPAGPSPDPVAAPDPAAAAALADAQEQVRVVKEKAADEKEKLERQLQDAADKAKGEKEDLERQLREAADKAKGEKEDLERQLRDAAAAPAPVQVVPDPATTAALVAAQEQAKAAAEARAAAAEAELATLRAQQEEHDAAVRQQMANGPVAPAPAPVAAPVVNQDQAPFPGPFTSPGPESPASSVVGSLSSVALTAPTVPAPADQTDTASTDSLASVTLLQAGRGFYNAVSLVKDAVARVARARNRQPPTHIPVQKATATRWTNADQLRANKQNQDALVVRRRQQQQARLERMAQRARSKTAVAPAPPGPELQAALENANDAAAQAVQVRRTSVVDDKIEALNDELAFYLDWLTQQEAETGFVPTKLGVQPPRGGRRKSPRRGRRVRNSTFRRHRKH